MSIYRTSVSSKLGVLTLTATEQGIVTAELSDRAVGLSSEDLPEPIAGWAIALQHYCNGEGAWPLLPVVMNGTPFQQTVWTALRNLPAGAPQTYSDLACAIGRPDACRAVARACATNAIAIAIPCHRVVPKGGGVGGFRWGIERKQALLRLEGGSVTQEQTLIPEF